LILLKLVGTKSKRRKSVNIFNPSTWFKTTEMPNTDPGRDKLVYVVKDYTPMVEQESKPKEVTSAIQRADLAYNTSVNDGDIFYPSEYNLNDVAAAYDIDGYFRRMVDKYVDLIWRNGYEFIGDNKRATNYIKARFEQISQVTEVPTRQLLEDLSQNLVLYSNSFILKARSEAASGGRPRETFDGRRLAPVAGYFCTDTPNMWIKRNENGKVLRYKQILPGKQPVEFVPSNVIHIYYDKKPGTAFGTPVVTPVLADIEALRKMEENIELLVFQHAIPFFELSRIASL
jgi:hypothetical protein